jgi:hypothetical protein
MVVWVLSAHTLPHEAIVHISTDSVRYEPVKSRISGNRLQPTWQAKARVVLMASNTRLSRTQNSCMSWIIISPAAKTVRQRGAILNYCHCVESDDRKGGREIHLNHHRQTRRRWLDIIIDGYTFTMYTPRAAMHPLGPDWACIARVSHFAEHGLNLSCNSSWF